MKTFTKVLLFLSTILPITTSAHVSYVVKPEDAEKVMGPNPVYLQQALFDPFNIFLMITTAIVVVGIFVFIKKIPFFNKAFHKIIDKLNSYHELIPWILRLALGISLIGAGTAGVFISPTLSDGQVFSFIQIAIGFCFLAGFLIAPAAIATIGIYVYALLQEPYLIGNMDVLALSLSVLVFHSARPGIDDILNISLLKFLKIHRYWLPIIIRLGVGIAFIYLALHEKLLNPGLSNLVVEQYNLTAYVPVMPAMWVLGAGIIELLLGILIISGYYTRVVGVVGILVLSLTFFYFEEAVYSHVTLFSALAIITIEGGGMFSVDRLLKKS